MKCFIIETRELNRSKTGMKSDCYDHRNSDNSFQALRDYGRSLFQKSVCA